VLLPGKNTAALNIIGNEAGNYRIKWRLGTSTLQDISRQMQVLLITRFNQKAKVRGPGDIIPFPIYTERGIAEITNPNPEKTTQFKRVIIIPLLIKARGLDWDHYVTQQQQKPGSMIPHRGTS
jgi:hypothetical protein